MRQKEENKNKIEKEKRKKNNLVVNLRAHMNFAVVILGLIKISSFFISSNIL